MTIGVAPDGGFKFVGLSQVSSLTGLPETWIKKEASEGRIPHIVVNNRMFFCIDRVRQTLLRMSEQKPRPQKPTGYGDTVYGAPKPDFVDDGFGPFGPPDQSGEVK